MHALCRTQTSYKCQLCDKKFKGSEYLTKHMHNKHGADIDAFRAEEREKVRACGSVLLVGAVASAGRSVSAQMQ